MSFHINLGSWGSVFAVPSDVVDKCFNLVSVYQLKVLLFMLRHSGEELTAEGIGKELSIHTDDVKDSIYFWVQMGILQENGDELVANRTVSQTASPEIKQEEEKPAVQPRPLTRQPRPDIHFVSQQLSRNSALASLLGEAQTILKKTLSSGDICTVYMLYDTYGLPPEVILMLIQYSDSIGRATLHFIEKEGIRWADEGIFTVEQAERKIAEMKNRHSAWGTVCSVFGMSQTGSPTKTQLTFADCWVNEWKFSDEMLREAYERCVDSKNGCDLKYINGILKNWRKSGYKNVEEVRENDVSPKKKTAAKKSGASSYDVDELDKTSFFDE